MAGAARYKQIVDQIAAAIRAGDLAAGTQLPTHRELARTHRVAVATATRVYAELAAIGLVGGEPGRGTFVLDQHGYHGIDAERTLPVTRIADLSFNQPLAVDQTAQLRNALREIAGSGTLDSLLYQHPPAGRSHDRAIVANYLLDRGIDVAPDQVVLTHGAQHGIDTVLTATTRPGNIIAADTLTYPGLLLAANAHRLEIAPIPQAGVGPDLDALEHLCRTRPIRAIYTMPTVHNPLGWTLNADTRHRLADIATTHDCLIIEDGTYAFLDNTAPLPLQHYAPDRTFYLASLSKSLATGLRFGFTVAPTTHRRALETSLRASTWGTTPLITALATTWIADGTLTHWEKARRADARHRQHLAHTALHTLHYTAHPTSQFGWLPLPPHLRADTTATHLAHTGILVTTADTFTTTTHPPHALRLALASPPLTQLPTILNHIHHTINTIPG
ncbi:PLP-dependent aminotransferase family protein [Gordonia soli]|uniref:Putative GntR family transcriptional regulator n=1 Tax=Gordonia soli NBRC 108243 TaxID=1223545 RepID=M0QNF4_9ACTN|nr:PLP-dependent aminotransferase family protein [Gordonia soli]GAC70195.1 putative GntR family transcriptional regulator [Gordonia soli NBRC 108243]